MLYKRALSLLQLPNLAIGADGSIIEVHPCPQRASDGAQSLICDEFARLMEGLWAPIRVDSGFKYLSAPVDVSDFRQLP